MSAIDPTDSNDTRSPADTPGVVDGVEGEVEEPVVIRTPAFEFVRQLGEDIAAGDFDLPPFPDTGLRVQRCVKNPDSTVQDLASIVANEPTLAARLMRMANSAAMRRGPVEVTDIPTAISRIGMEMVQNVAVSYAAREAFKCPPGNPSIDELNALRRHSIKVSTVSYFIARYSPFGGKPEEAMLAGLLHAVGKFYIYMRAAEFPELFTDGTILEPIVARWHTGVAEAIVTSWEFPDSVAHGVDEQEVVSRHRAGAADLSDILFLANLLTRNSPGTPDQLVGLDALARLRMSAEDLMALLERRDDEIQSMIDALTL